MVFDLNKDNFSSFDNGVIDFWATWCGPCRMLSPILDAVAEETGITVGKVNVDEEVEIARRFGIDVIPTLVFIKEGRETGRVSGYRPKDELQAILSKFLA